MAEERVVVVPPGVVLRVREGLGDVLAESRGKVLGEEPSEAVPPPLALPTSDCVAAAVDVEPGRRVAGMGEAVPSRLTVAVALLPSESDCIGALGVQAGE